MQANRIKLTTHFLSSVLTGFLLAPTFGHAQVLEEGEALSETDAALLAEEQAYYAWATEFSESLDRQTGLIELPGGIASLEVPEEFYYLSPEDSKRVLEEAWGNIPDDQLNLGMLFPSKYSPLDAESWGVTIDFEADGYVSDKDAKDIDYRDLLKQMQSDTREESKMREEQGYDTIQLVGWAAEPYYDASSHKLYWAKELKFGGYEENILNYNVRALGRRGVLVLNFIANMGQLDEIEASRDQVLAMASFNDGHRYSQFNPDIDKVAAYGIGGLIAGKALLKTGLLAGLLILLKKFWFLLLLPFVGLKKFFGTKAGE